ncbi:MAG: hypothetical protein K1X88_19755 [Nannocystaceae bacterium]|nr:hypothetical protein [Nannocystaceae bacterium]
MPKVVYGVFSGALQAERVAAELNKLSESNAMVFGEGVREEDVQLGGTLALRTGIVTGLVVGVVAAFLIWAVLWPMNGMTLTLEAFGLLVFMGSLFGIVAGAVAGAAECKPSIVDVAGRARAQGNTVITCEVPDREVAHVVHAMTEAGCASVHAA